MAETGASGDGATAERFRQMLECSICLELYTNPKMLKCTHEYCKHCVEELLTFQNDGTATITCPLRCHNKTTLKNNETVNDLAASFTIKHILDTLHTEPKDVAGITPPCKIHKDCIKHVSVFCCGKLYCDSCHQEHKTNISVKHSVLKLSVEPPDDKLVVLCDKHSSVCTHLCVDEKLLCIYCLHRDEQHKGHAKNDIGTEAKLIRDAINQEVMAHKDAQMLVQDSYTTAYETLKLHLKQRKERCITEYKSLLEREEKLLIGQCSDVYSSYVEQIEKATPTDLTVYGDLLKKLDLELVLHKEEILSLITSQREHSAKKIKGYNVLLTESFDFRALRPLGELHNRIAADKKLSFTFPMLLCPEEKPKVEDNCETKSTCVPEDTEANVEVKSVGADQTDDNNNDDCCGALESSTEKNKKKKKKKKKQSSGVDAQCGDPNKENCQSVANADSDETLKSNSSTSAQEYKLKGNDFFRQSKFDAAIESYSKAINVCPKENASDLSVYYQNRAAANEKLNQWDNVVKDCTVAINMNPTYVKALYRRSEAYRRLEKGRNAYQDYFIATSFQEKQGKDTSVEEAAMTSMASSLAQNEMFKLISNRPKGQIPSISVIRDAFRYYNYDVYHIATSTEKCDTNYLEILRLLKEENFEPMLILCDKEITLKGMHHSKALSLRGTFKIVVADNMDAREDLLKVKRMAWEEENYLLAFDAELKVTHLMTSMKTSMNLPSYDVIDKYDAIVDNYDDMGKHLAALHVIKGRYLRVTRRFKEAKCAFKKAIKLDAAFLMARFQLALCLYEEQGGHEANSLTSETEEAYVQMIKACPGHATAWEHFCTALGNVGRFKEANKKIDHAISLAPHTADPYVVKATNIIVHTQRYDEAHALLHKALELDPKFGNAWRCLSQIEQEKGNWGKELEYLEEAVKWVLKMDELAVMFERMEEVKAMIKLQTSVSIIVNGMR